jgi:hypothetical protein
MSDKATKDQRAAIEQARNAPRIDPSAPRPATRIPGDPRSREVLGGHTDRDITPGTDRAPAIGGAKQRA